MSPPTAGEYLVDVVGESHYQSALAAICGPRSEGGEYREVAARLVLEDDNQYDANAVAVKINSRKVGHLNRANAVAFRRWLSSSGHSAANLTCPAVIVGGWRREDGDTGSYGVVLDLAVPGLELREEPPFDPRGDGEGDDIVIEIEYAPPPRRTIAAAVASKPAYVPAPPAPQQSGSSWTWLWVVLGIALLVFLLFVSFPR